MKDLIVVRGGGDIATGTACKLHRCGFPVVILETAAPAAIRRTVAFSEAVWQGFQTVEDVTCELARSVQEAQRVLAGGKIALLVDPWGHCIPELEPLAVVDAILAKRNLGTHRGMAPITIGLGPGFCAGEDVDAVVETVRGHNLGRVIWQGTAAPNTGIPGMVGGYGPERVLRSPAEGIFRPVRAITDTVKKGEEVAFVETESGKIPVTAAIDGLLRGLLREGYPVTAGFKVGDVDPRGNEADNCYTISDKARCIAGGVLEGILRGKGRLDCG